MDNKTIFLKELLSKSKKKGTNMREYQTLSLDEFESRPMLMELDQFSKEKVEVMTIQQSGVDEKIKVESNLFKLSGDCKTIEFDPEIIKTYLNNNKL
ncbi:MAG: hypothetical protein LBE36_08690 [Flavobacteriaceae bacterium]|jgi:hypothetical protein|nr:hypothetical protein [Flavobacteriaceae bacterium]